MNCTFRDMPALLMEFVRSDWIKPHTQKYTINKMLRAKCYKHVCVCLCSFVYNIVEYHIDQMIDHILVTFLKSHFFVFDIRLNIRTHTNTFYSIIAIENQTIFFFEKEWNVLLSTQLLSLSLTSSLLLWMGILFSMNLIA